MSLDNSPLLYDDNLPLSLRQGDRQGDFISIFNALNRIMASMPDIYEAGKTGDDAVLESLRKDFEDSWEISSTMISYEKDSLEATITHYFGSTVIEPNEKILVIPYYSGTKLDDVLKDEQGLAYLQVLFNTTDGAEEIKDTLEKLSSKESKQIKIWTPGQDSRAQCQNRAAGFNYYGGDFRVNGNYDLYLNGRSRGVLECPAGAALKNGAPKRADQEPALPFELKEGIDKRAGCVCFSNVQKIADYTRYSALVCFDGSRYVVSFTASNDNSGEWDKRICGMMSEATQTKAKLERLFGEFSPIYAHILKYQQESGKFALADDIEAFGEPRIKEAGK